MIIKVLHTEFNVVLGDEVWFRATQKIGQMDPVHNVITIYGNMHLNARMDCFFHELIHAFWFIMFPSEPLDEESTCRFIAPLLTLFIVENSTFMKLLIEGNEL